MEQPLGLAPQLPPDIYTTTPLYKTVTLAELAAINPPPYLVDGFLRRNTLTMISSEPHTGKTMLALDLMLCMESGQKYLKTFDIPADMRTSSLFIAMDSPKWDIAGQLKKLALGHNITMHDLEMFDSKIIPRREARINIFDAQLPEFLKQLRSTHGIDVLFIDTIRRIHSANENDSGEMGAVMDRLERLVDDEGFTIIFNTHTSKPMGGVTRSVNYAARGSTVISGSVDFHYHLHLDSRGRIVLNGTEKRRGESKGQGNILLEMIDLPGGGLVIQPIETTTSTPAEQNPVEAAVIKALTSISPQTAPALMKETGTSSYWKLQKALTNLASTGRIKRVARGEWALEQQQ